MPTKDEIKKFSTQIEQLAEARKLTLMDAIIYHCKETGLEIEVSASLISAALKAKIKLEAQDLNLLKKTSKLPL